MFKPFVCYSSIGNIVSYFLLLVLIRGLFNVFFKFGWNYMNFREAFLVTLYNI